MDYKYLLLRYQTFRDEHLALTYSWLKSSGAWLWQFTLDNFRFLYMGEIHQINLLRYTLKQKDDYIAFLQSHRHTSEHPLKKEKKRAPEGMFWGPLSLVIRIILTPTSFLIYWVRRLLRMILNRRFRMLAHAHPPTEDLSFEDSYSGQNSVYIFPDRRQAFPRGLVIFRYRLSVSSGNPAPVLLINPGTGFVSNYTIAIPFLNSDIQELLLELPPDIALMKLVVGSTDTGFRISDISMTEINALQAARYLKQNYGFTAEEVLNTLFLRKLPGVRRIQGHRISYAHWRHKYARLTTSDRLAIQNHISTFRQGPKFSVIIPVNNSNPELLDLTLESLHNQLYPEWEALICCQELPDAHVTMVLNRYERHDKRFKLLIDPAIAAISRSAGDAIHAATGAFTVFLHQGDLLAAHACYLAAATLMDKPASRLLYTDHDYIDHQGMFFDPCLKPDWNYDFFLGKNYIGHTAFFDTGELKKLPSQDEIPLDDYRRILGFIEHVPAETIVHIPYILFHQRTNTPAPLPAGGDTAHQATLNEHLQRTGQAAAAVPAVAGFHIKRRIPDPQPLVSLIVLTRDRVALLSNCINGILNKTRYRNLDVIIIDNGSIEPSTLTYLEAIGNDPRVRVFRRPEEFNFSELNNFAVAQARGEYIGLVNNDISIINDDDDWLDEMTGHLLRPDVGIVGAKLFYNDDTVQHAGVIIGLGGVAGHGFRDSPRDWRGYDDRLVLCQQLSCVTAACLMTKKSIYDSVGGMDAINLRITFNDVDYCLKVREQGWKIIWTPFAELYHLESASRDSDLSQANINRWNSEYNFMRNKWRPVLEYDPFYNPNLGIADEEFALARPPRLIHPWERYRYVNPNNPARTE